MKNISIVITLLLAAFSVQALNLKEKTQLKEWNEYLKSPDQSYIKSAKDKCGFEITVTLQDAMVTPFMTANANAASFCDEVRSKIAYMCEDATAKAEIKKKVKKISCQLSKKAEEMKFDLKKDGTLVFMVNTGASNIGDKTKEYLDTAL